jgi:phosphatidylglycerol lysyltransferase
MSSLEPPPKDKKVPEPDEGGRFSNVLSYETARSLLRPPWGILLLVWLVRLSAVINLISSFWPENQVWSFGVVTEIPFEISEGRQVRLVLLSVLLFILASALVRGKRAAWVCTIAILLLIPILHLGHAVAWPEIIANVFLIVLLLYHRRYFVSASDRQSVRSALIICPLLGILLLVFGTVRLHDLRDETSGSDDWLACFQTAGELEFTQGSDSQQPETFATARFFSILCISGTLIALLGLFLALRPVLMQRRFQGESREKVRRLIEQYGDDSHDSYALLHDKRYFFSSDGQAAVAYVLSDNIAVALADPIGPASLKPMAIVDFALFCRRQDWETVFYAVGEELTSYYKQAGLSLFKIGEAANLQADHFQLKGNDFQNLRTLRNGAHRRGIRFKWYDAVAGIDEVLEDRLSDISQQWLDTKHAREMAFDMGAFSVEEIRQHGAAIAIDPSGTPLAFATWRPFAKGKGRALDLMRTLPHARNVMDFVLIESIAHFNALGITRVNLGLAPLANTEQSPSRLVAEEKVVQFLFENLNHIYGYKSLFEFKRKYRPHWRGRYVAYRRGVQLPLVGLAMVRVHAPEGLLKFIFN